MTLLQVKHLSKSYQIGKDKLHAVVDLSFDLAQGETLGLVGESGCGKSTLGRCLLYLEKPSSGEVLFQGQNLAHMSKQQLHTFRKHAQVIFQDPYAALNPRMTAFDLIAEPLYIHKEPNVAQRVQTLLDLVGLPAASQNRFPHEFSGGQRQRIGIARALALKPELIVCDEPISALDVSIQAQIVNLLKTLQKELQLTLLFIAHDLSMVRYISDRVAVMYLGHLMELTTAEKLYDTPLHPYTQALLSAIPTPDPTVERKRQKLLLASEIPSPKEIRQGCPFASRCPKVMDKCLQAKPKLHPTGEGHLVACHLYEGA